MASNRVKNKTDYRLTCTLADTEVSQAITSSSCYVRAKFESLANTGRITLTAAASGTGEQISEGQEWFTPEPLPFGAKTIYVQSPNAGAILHIVVWELD